MSHWEGIHQAPAAEVFRLLQTRHLGLSLGEVQERLTEVGPNLLTPPKRYPWAARLLKQFTNFFTILLNISAAICFIAHAIEPGQSMNVLGFALLGVSLLNALFSFIQEYRAERAMEALAKFLPQKVTVRRNEREQQVLADSLVPGDVLLVNEGDRIAADARLVSAEGLRVNNAPLTGESHPVSLSAAPAGGRQEDAANMVFAGCQVLSGTGEAVIFATGGRTAFGKIAALSGGVTRVVSPLERETNHMVRVLTAIAVGMGVTFFGYGVATGRDLMVNLVFMMGIIVANVPEGLLPTYTLSLAMGSLRMARRNVLVKSLNAVEAIGAIHVICTDKTGTLTKNQLQLTRLAAPLDGDPLSGSAEEELLLMALAASDVREREGRMSGDPLDVAIAKRFAEAGGQPFDVMEHLARRYPFDVAKRRSGGVWRGPDGHVFATKGAWESLRPFVTSLHTVTGETPADDAALAAVDTTVHTLASQGFRVIAVAAGPVAPPAETTEAETLEKDLTLVGFLCLEDPLREEVPPAVAQCHEAGIDVVLITGDHPDTAEAVAKKAGLLPPDMPPGAATLTGSDLQAMTPGELARQLESGVRLFARTTPEQKMKIVLALQAMGKVVAMTGDGVNDAPALKAAEVGIAMGKDGTDVARESAQIILLDDNFASIVAGVEEGRTVFNNIRKFTNYVLVSNGPEILPYLLFILFPVPLAMTIIQILSIDLGTDIIPSMALGQEPPEKETMQRPPRSPKEGLLRFPLIAHSYFFLGLLEALWSFGLFFLVLHQGGWHYGDPIMATTDPLYQSATGIALSTILLMQIGNLLGRRYARRSGLDLGIFRNKLLLAGIVIQVVFSWATLYWPPMNTILGTQPVAVSIYLLAWLGIPLIFGADWLRKQAAAWLAARRLAAGA